MILSIDTSTNACSVALHSEGELIASASFILSKSHSSLIPSIIEQLMEHSGIQRKDLVAVGVSSGPGSYTGLRIGISAAKAICFGLDIPLVSVDALDTMIAQIPGEILDEDDLLIPMLDARRDEVYTKVVDKRKGLVAELQALILDKTAFSELRGRRFVLFGDGGSKAVPLLNHDQTILVKDIRPSAEYMGRLIFEKFSEHQHEDIAYFEPIYLKEFQTKKSKDLLRP